MGTKFRVRLKTKAKLQIIGRILVLAIPIALIGLYVFDFKFAQTEYKGFFKAEINRVLATGGQMSYHSVSYKGRTYKVASIKRLRLNQKVCIGIVEHVVPFKINTYFVVDDNKYS